jgi:hypothetical protein
MRAARLSLEDVYFSNFKLKDPRKGLHSEPVVSHPC